MKRDSNLPAEWTDAKTSSPLISIIIVNLNGEEYLGDCLRSLDAQSFREFEVIVVDNGSTDGSLSLIRNKFPWVRLIDLEENMGFSRGNNLGIVKADTKYIATLNNDTIADSGWLEALYQAAEMDSTIGMVASKILLGKDGRTIDSVGMLVYPDGMSRQQGRGETDQHQFDGIKDILFPSACAALYRCEMLQRIGYFDEDFFSYCEDTDLGLRARLAGWKAVLAPLAEIRHLYSQTGGPYSSFKAYHVERNRMWVLLKDLPLSYIVMFPLYSLWRYLVQAYSLLTGKGNVARFAESAGRSGLMMVVLRAYVDALSRLPKMLAKRRDIWSRKLLSVTEYKRLLRKHHISAQELILRD